MGDWVITIPKTIAWSEYQKELDACADDEEMVLSYRLPFKPSAKPGEKCYVVHDGYIRGYQTIDNVEHIEGFECLTTKKHWRDGWYIVRSGMFHKIKPIQMTGFRGIRRMSHTGVGTAKGTGQDG